jgi:hypothetical protein
MGRGAAGGPRRSRPARALRGVEGGRDAGHLLAAAAGPGSPRGIRVLWMVAARPDSLVGGRVDRSPSVSEPPTRPGPGSPPLGSQLEPPRAPRGARPSPTRTSRGAVRNGSSPGDSRANITSRQRAGSPLNCRSSIATNTTHHQDSGRHARPRTWTSSCNPAAATSMRSTPTSLGRVTHRPRRSTQGTTDVGVRGPRDGRGEGPVADSSPQHPVVPRRSGPSRSPRPPERTRAPGRPPCRSGSSP